jgi:hypothetical protein
MLEIPSSKTTAAIGRGKLMLMVTTPTRIRLPENTRGAALIKDVFGDLNTHYGNEVFKTSY